MPEANAMENPAAIATQLTPLVAASPCAKAGTANDSTDSTINNLLNLRIVFFPRMKYRQWVVDAIPCRRPHACGLKPVASGQLPVASRNLNLQHYFINPAITSTRN